LGAVRRQLANVAFAFKLMHSLQVPPAGVAAQGRCPSLRSASPASLHGVLTLQPSWRGRRARTVPDVVDRKLPAIMRLLYQLFMAFQSPAAV